MPPQPPERKRRLFPAEGPRRGRVAFLDGCVNPILSPPINESAIRVLNRLGIEVVLAEGEGCCGSLTHHMGREAQALAQAADILLLDEQTNHLDAESAQGLLVLEGLLRGEDLDGDPSAVGLMGGEPGR